MIAETRTSLDIAITSDFSSMVRFVVPSSAYADMAGNAGFGVTVYMVPLDMGFTTSYLARGAVSLSLTTLAVSVTTSIFSSVAVAATQGVLAKSNLLRAGYHLQLLSMSSNLAVPKVSDSYRMLVKQLGWSTLNVQLEGLNTITNNLPRRRMMEIDFAARLTGDLLYTLILSTIALSIILALHLLINYLLHRWLKRQLVDVLKVPCVEVLLMGFILVALSFYASISLGPRSVSETDKRYMAIHVAMCLPYLAFLLWIALLKSTEHSSMSTLQNGDQVSYA